MPEYEQDDEEYQFINTTIDKYGTKYLYTTSRDKQPRPQKELLDFSADEGKKVNICYQDEKNRYFGYYSNANHFVSEMCNVPSEDRHFYEILNAEVKFYADLDWNKDVEQDHKYNNENYAIKDFLELFEEVYNEVVQKQKYNPKKVFLLNASNKSKGSIHMIYYDKHYFNNTTEQKIFWDYFASLEKERTTLKTYSAEDKVSSIVDYKIYTKNRNFRTIYSSKYGSDRVLIPISLEGTPIKPTRSKMISYLVNVPNTLKGKRIKLNIDTIDIELKKLNEETIVNLGDLDEIEKIIYDRVPNVTICSRKGKMIVLKNNGVRKCIIQGEDNYSDNSYVLIKDDGLYFGCHDGDCNGILKCIYSFPISYCPSMSWDWFFNACAEIKTREQTEKVRREVVAYMNKYYNIITAQSKTIIIQHIYEKKVIEGKTFTYIKKQHMTFNSVRKELENISCIYTYTEKDKKGKEEEITGSINAFSTWWYSRYRKQFKYIEFNPKTSISSKFQNPNAYNLWHNYLINPKDLKDIKPLEFEHPYIQHIYKRWAKKDINIFNFIMGWCATTLQQPWKKLRSNLVVRGREGAGKGILISALGKIIGEEYYLQPSTPNSILGDFNSGLEGKKMIFLDELFWGGDKQKAGVLKKLITEETININRKHVPDYTIENNVNIAISSNEEWVVPAGEQARRYCVIDIDNEFAGVNLPREVKKELNAVIETPLLRIAKTFYDWEIVHFDDRNPPQTESLRDQKILSFDPIMKYINDLLVQGYFEIHTESFQFNQWITKSLILEDFRNNYNNKHITKTSFWKKIDEIFVIKTAIKKVDFIEGGKNIKKRITCVFFKDIETMRKNFKKYIKDDSWTF